MVHRPLLSIVGPTATGKSALALWAANHFANKVSILSADSRQVYKGMNIATGADIPSNFVPTEDHWQSIDGKTAIYGVTRISPTSSWSAYDFVKLAHGIIAETWKTDGLPILVGGTGLYHQLLWRPAHFRTEDIHVFPAAQIRPEVRDKAAELSVEELQHWAAEADLERFNQLNQSDRSNPRRLVRVIEKALFQLENAGNDIPPLPELERPVTQLTIGLTAPLDVLKDAISVRVKERIQAGAILETEKLVANYSEEEWKNPSFSATGYRELRRYLEGQIDLPTATEQWILREFRYAKRQLTWWKKYAAAEWFDISSADNVQAAQQKISEWINTFTPAEK